MAMEMELGLKITQTREDIASYALFKKDRTNHPPFKYTETDTKFLLMAHLSGFKKNQLKVEIDRTGTKIAISGEKWVQEMVMVGWQMQKKDPQIRRFRRVFQIPEGIVVDRIKARFDELDSSLTIYMPKSRKGIQGIQIKDISHEEEQQEVIGTSATTEPMEDSAKQGMPELPDGGLVKDSQMGREEVEEIERWEETFEKEHEGLTKKSGVEVPPHRKVPIIPEGTPHDQIEELVIPDSTAAGIADEREAAVSAKISEECPEADTKVPPLESAEEKEKQAEEVEHTDTGPVGQDTGEALQGTTDDVSSRPRFCRPRCLIAGSTIIISLVVAVLHLLKTRRNQKAIRERRD